MTTVKFDHAVKYKGVRYPAHVAFDVSDQDVPALKASGAVVIATEPVDPPANSQESEQPVDDQAEESEQVEGKVDLKAHLLTFTIPELIKFAEDNDIDLKGKTRKADIYNIIVASLN